MKNKGYNTTGKPVSYTGYYNDLLKNDKSRWSKGVFLDEGKPLPFKELKTYPTHRLYSVWVFKKGKKLSWSEKSFFRDFLFYLLTPNHDDSKSYRKQVSDFFKRVQETSTHDEDGRLVFQYGLQLKEPVTLKLENFQTLFRANKKFYKEYYVNGKLFQMGTNDTKLRTKEDTQKFEKYNEQLKMVA